MIISIIIPTADRPKLLDRAIKSIALLSELPAEVIIIDDGITSINDDYFKSIETNHCRLTIKYKKTKGKEGPSASRNIGVEIANGDILLFLDDDDEMLADYTQRVRNILKNHHDIDFGFSN